jgi:hypothetical protein
MTAESPASTEHCPPATAGPSGSLESHKPPSLSQSPGWHLQTPRFAVRAATDIPKVVPGASSASGLVTIHLDPKPGHTGHDSSPYRRTLLQRRLEPNAPLLQLHTELAGENFARLLAGEYVAPGLGHGAIRGETGRNLPLHLRERDFELRLASLAGFLGGKWSHRSWALGYSHALCRQGLRPE